MTQVLVVIGLVTAGGFFVNAAYHFGRASAFRESAAMIRESRTPDSQPTARAPEEK